MWPGGGRGVGRSVGGGEGLTPQGAKERNDNRFMQYMSVEKGTQLLLKLREPLNPGSTSRSQGRG